MPQVRVRSLDANLGLVRLARTLLCAKYQRDRTAGAIRILGSWAGGDCHLERVRRTPNKSKDPLFLN